MKKNSLKTFGEQHNDISLSYKILVILSEVFTQVLYYNEWPMYLKSK